VEHAVYEVRSIDPNGRRRIASIRVARSKEDAIEAYLAEGSPVAGRTYSAKRIGSAPVDGEPA